MDCPNWPPPLPSLPLYPPCKPNILPPPPPPVKIKESKTQEWWDENLAPILNRLSGEPEQKVGNGYELTQKQRRDLLSIRTHTKQDKLIWSVPLPKGSYPQDGLPIWERLYLDRKLPMLKCPPNSLVFARQQIGKKLWKNTGGQEFILYDPHSYDMTFCYENVHDPHLSTYYQGKEIRGFLLRVGDATEDGWGLCSLKRFNQYRRYLKRVHLSLVHAKMKRQEALKDEILKIKEYRQTTTDTMIAIEQKIMVEEVRAAILEYIRQYHVNRTNKILAKIKEKDERVQRLYKKRERDKELRRQIGLRLLAEQELKNKIASEIKRRKKIATLRQWHDTEEKTLKRMKKSADEKAKLKAEKVRLRWAAKIENSRKMFEKEDECLKLQTKVREENIKIRNAYNEKLKQNEKERFQELQQQGLKRKALVRRQKEEKRMEKALTDTWIHYNHRDYDLATEVYRVKKSLNSTMAELLATQMEGPDRFSIILMSRNRIQREQRVPLQVSYAIDAILETTIKSWVDVRLLLIIETVTKQVKENGYKMLAEVKLRNKNPGIPTTGNFKSRAPRGKIYMPDSKEEKKKTEKVKKSMKMNDDVQDEKTEKDTDTHALVKTASKTPASVVHNYVHYGSTIVHEYSLHPDIQTDLKPIVGRPKTPMPTQEVLCEAGFSEDRLNDILPTLSEEVTNLKEKHKLRRVFRKTAVQLFKRSLAITSLGIEPVRRFRTVTKLAHLGENEKSHVSGSLCELIMSMDEKNMFKTEEFDWITRVIAREVIKEILNPPEFNKEEADNIARTKIMFYAPKPKK